MAIRVIEDIEVSYFKHQLESRDSFQTKRALQYICELYRRDGRFSAADLFGIENTVVGLIQTSADNKVKRWALNTIARIGRRDVCLRAVLDALENYSDNADVVGAAIAALFKLDNPGAYKLLTDKDRFSQDLILLSALQNTSASSLDLKRTKIDIDVASPDILKLALITVGLDKAPENIFHPKHSNSAIVKALGKHDDSIVAQYSVWAVVENAKLSTRDIGIDLRRLDERPANVRAWVYQLFGSENGPRKRRHEMVLRGSADHSDEARIGLATGLRDTYYANLDKVVTEWHLKEANAEVSALTVDHMVRQIDHSKDYENLVRQIFEAAGVDSPARGRILAMAARTKFYPELRKAEVLARDLFTMTKDVHIGTLQIGTLQASAVAFGGSAVSYGNTGNVLSAAQIGVAKEVLAAARDALQALESSPEARSRVIDEIEGATQDPSPTKLQGVGKALEALSNNLIRTADTAEAIHKIGTYGGQILDLVSKFTT
ncbi:hypothetical protein IZ6_20440 [Terrihabitans soli]|uniref:HEAT repeat domain-containing protein n=1 Tax=Terrihabitans soli TaxID=708113 RepID=A0A6S6QQJ0_9HYPH|nr:hypothetical protein [Terrihabitans soli]BCJ91309.1 hypothetical protein IZ6_20440 [Terrihabitans soli]